MQVCDVQNAEAQRIKSQEHGHELPIGGVISFVFFFVSVTQDRMVDMVAAVSVCLFCYNVCDHVLEIRL